MRLALELVVTAIIILVVAIVVLAIFGGGISQLGSVTDARASCINQGKWSCETSGVMPAGWDTITVFRQGNEAKTCKDLTGQSAAEACTTTYDASKGIVHTWNIK